MQKQKSDKHTRAHARPFVSEIGGAGKDDIHTQTGTTASDTLSYFRKGKGKILQDI